MYSLRLPWLTAKKYVLQGHPVFLLVVYCVVYFTTLLGIVVRYNLKLKEIEGVPISIVLDHCGEKLEWLEQHYHELCWRHSAWFYVYERCGQRDHVNLLKVRYPQCNFIQIDLDIPQNNYMHAYLYHIMNSPDRFHTLNYFLQSSRPTCSPFPPQDGLSKLKEKMTSCRKSKQGNCNYWSNLGYAGCPVQSGGSVDNKQASVLEMCNMYTAITGSSNNCNKFIASHGGNFVASFQSLSELRINKRKSLESALKLVSEGNSTEHNLMVEMLWGVWFQGSSSCEGLKNVAPTCPVPY